MLEGHTSSVFAVAFSTDGGKIVSASRDNTVRVWSTETCEVWLVLIDCCMADGLVARAGWLSTLPSIGGV